MILLVLLVACLFAFWVVYQVAGWVGLGALMGGYFACLAVWMHGAPQAGEADQ